MVEVRPQLFKETQVGNHEFIYLLEGLLNHWLLIPSSRIVPMALRAILRRVVDSNSCMLAGGPFKVFSRIISRFPQAALIAVAEIRIRLDIWPKS